MEEKNEITAINIDGLFNDVRQIIDKGREEGTRSVQSIICITYWRIGQRIVGLIVKREDEK